MPGVDYSSKTSLELGTVQGPTPAPALVQAPLPLECSKPGCNYSTPAGCPTWPDVIKLLELHTKQAHSTAEESQEQQLVRPRLDVGASQHDWGYFLAEWERYKRLSQLGGQETKDELWACASKELASQCEAAGAGQKTSEKKLLGLLKRYSITSVAIVDCDTEGEQAAGLETDGESDNICAFLAAKVCRGIYCTLMGSLVILAILSVVAIVEGVVGQLGLQSK